MELTGYGDGSGSGSGDGSGYSDGYGYGDDHEVYWSAILASYRAPGSVVCFWRSQKDGSPANGGKSFHATPGLVQSVEGPLELCGERALHGTKNPDKWKGERWWVVALKEPVASDDDKLGSLERKILADLGKWPFDK